jgi:hypothetical protein
VRIDAPGVASGVVFSLRIKRAGARYCDLGNLTSAVDGTVTFPVFTPTRPGKFVLVLSSPDGTPRYLKLNVRPWRG